MKKKIKKVFMICIALILTIVSCIAFYCGYVIISYSRIGDVELQIDNNATYNQVLLNTKVVTGTYNKHDTPTGYNILKKERSFRPLL